MTDGNRVVVVGFDALDFKYLDAFDDSLPNFSSLRARGVEAPLRSTFPPWTGSAWPSMYTGTDPSYHGVFDFFDHSSGYPDEAPVVSRNDVRAPALWNYFTARGSSSVVLNVPVTHPAEDIEGVVVPGYLASEDERGSPEGIRKELSDAIGREYRIYSSHELAENNDRKLSGYLDLIERRRDAARYLLDANDWQFAFLQVQKTDTVFHNFDDRTAFRAVYEAADDFLGMVLDYVDADTNVIVCSDHGMGPTTGYTVYVNELLKRRGNLSTMSGASVDSLGDRKAALTGASDEGTDNTVALPILRVTQALQAVGLSPGDLFAIARRVGVGDFLLRVLPDGVKESVSSGVDWRASRAYCRSNAELGIRVNLEGRDSEGTVPDEEYEVLRDELVEYFSSLESPDGEPVFERVQKREAVYDGPYADDACDVVFEPANMDYPISTKLYGSPFVPVDQFDHKRTGVFLGDGPAFADGAPAEIDLTSVAPTVMAAARVPIPERMAGSVPEDLLTEPLTRAKYEDVTYGSESSVNQEDAVTDRLEDLGYL